jgi:carbon monoxide dehydrogenase subunit G
MKQQHQVTAHIKSKPETVLAFIADVRNRTRYLSSLKSLTNIQGGPVGAGTTWNWKFAILGMEFDGTAHATQYEAGKTYAFHTEGGLHSKWIYRVEPEGEGTKLTVDVEYEIPAQVVSHLPSAEILESHKKTEGDQVIKNLRALLER